MNTLGIGTSEITWQPAQALRGRPMPPEALARVTTAAPKLGLERGKVRAVVDMKRLATNHQRGH